MAIFKDKKYRVPWNKTKDKQVIHKNKEGLILVSIYNV